MFDRKKYVLQKTAKYAVCTVMLISIINQAANLSNTNFPYTQNDIKNNKSYVHELQEIRNETPIFQNQDLYNELLNQGLDLNNLSSIKSITITNSLLNPNFSDLKYFPNLTNLHIENNDINLDDIKYNDNLLNLELINTKISNPSSIPNSVYNLTLQDTEIDDQSLTIPYNTKYLTLTNVPFNHIYLRNPLSLKKLSIVGNCFLDINSLKECNNLESLKLIRVPNVDNSSLLPLLPSLKTIELDDYAPIWLTKDTYHELKLDNQQILNEIIELDILSLDITANCKTEEEQIKEISKYILKRLSYDFDLTKQELNDYNDNPINYGINQKEGICINYASLFTALANRVGIDTYQIYSSSHTWNMFYKNGVPSFIDLTMLDTKTITEVLTEYGIEQVELEQNQSIELLESNQEQTLYHYEITLEELLNDPDLSVHTGLPNKNPKVTKDIGYIKNNGIAIEFNKRLYYVEYSKLTPLIMMIALLSLFLSLTKKDLNRPLLMTPEDTDYILKKKKKERTKNEK